MGTHGSIIPAHQTGVPFSLGRASRPTPKQTTPTPTSGAVFFSLTPLFLQTAVCLNAHLSVSRPSKQLDADLDPGSHRLPHSHPHPRNNSALTQSFTIMLPTFIRPSCQRTRKYKTKAPRTKTTRRRRRRRPRTVSPVRRLD
ncbi:hypothetical protein FIBSPDRAFT_470715 [Athelia psychrophila]|uniref:Uncharacterized protein n=1 Tax=Athelia psychrophila TaxID=1759441 RepID=A0A167U0M3_9AGAM|nr:hypothetical protein FIBSPDRAFT_470715 [Fibularhizoctonia sp. CBS 109695]